MVDIIHRIGIKAPAALVYQALTTLDGLAHWWTDEVSGDGKAGGRIAFIFRAKTGDILGSMTMEVTRLQAGRHVHWRCIDGPP